MVSGLPFIPVAPRMRDLARLRYNQVMAYTLSSTETSDGVRELLREIEMAMLDVDGPPMSDAAYVDHLTLLAPIGRGEREREGWRKRVAEAVEENGGVALTRQAARVCAAPWTTRRMPLTLLERSQSAERSRQQRRPRDVTLAVWGRRLRSAALRRT